MKSLVAAVLTYALGATSVHALSPVPNSCLVDMERQNVRPFFGPPGNAFHEAMMMGSAFLLSSELKPGIVTWHVIEPNENQPSVAGFGVRHCSSGKEVSILKSNGDALDMKRAFEAELARFDEVDLQELGQRLHKLDEAVNIGPTDLGSCACKTKPGWSGQ